MPRSLSLWLLFVFALAAIDGAMAQFDRRAPPVQPTPTPTTNAAPPPPPPPNSSTGDQALATMTPQASLSSAVPERTALPAPAAGNETQLVGNATQSLPPNANPFLGKPTSASYSNNVPPAYLTWKQPIPNQTFPPLYKIGSTNITFEWTVDPQALKVQPENLTIALANPQKQTYTAAVVAGTATSASWDLSRLQPGSPPLMVGHYTVWVYDQRGPKAYPAPGWLMPDSRLVVALYSTEAYVGRADSMFCPTCYLGAASSLRENFGPLLVALGVACFTSLVMGASIIA